MITGSVNANLEAIIQVVVVGTGTQKHQFEVVIDTGFSGFLTLPQPLIAVLKLTWLGREDGILADGRVELFDVYRATVIWDGKERFIEVQAVDAQALAGMELMQGHSLQMDVVSGGAVTITALP